MNFNQEEFHFERTLQVVNDREKYRELTLNRLKMLIDMGLVEETFEAKKYLSIFNQIHLIDGSFAVKVGVNFGLFGMSIVKLGTEKHKKYIQELVQGKIFGCFAMTEVSHGSDVKNIKTTATYNSQTNKFIINSNGEENRKCWIGNALDANYGVVFAQLILEKSYGVHAFIVDLKNVKRFDLGDKIGLQGVDNGMLEFDNVEVDYDCLLDRFSKIENGKFVSQFNQEKRFGNMLSALTLGRVALSCGVLQYGKKALYIALNYGMKRKQFTFDNKSETEIINYPNVFMRLIPNLCTLQVYETFTNYLIQVYEKDNEKVHKLSSGSKPLFSWFVLKVIQSCRECCGGNGYSQRNQFGILKNDTDIYTTFEGDNHMLLQQLAKILLTKYGEKIKKSTAYYSKLLLSLSNNSISDLVQQSQIVKLFRYKFLKKLLTILNEFRTRSQKQKNFFILWNESQQEVVECAKYYMDYKIVKEFKGDEISFRSFYIHSYQWILKNKYYLQHQGLITYSQLVQVKRFLDFYIKAVKLDLPMYVEKLNIQEYMVSKL